MEGDDRAPGFRYEYDVYKFSKGDIALVARSYADFPNEAHFLRIESRGIFHALKRTDLESPLCVEAVSYLRQEGKIRIEWLSEEEEGYSLLPE